jgi:hypothetical protein
VSEPPRHPLATRQARARGWRLIACPPGNGGRTSYRVRDWPWNQRRRVLDPIHPLALWRGSGRLGCHSDGTRGRRAMSSGTVKRSRSNGASLRRCSLAILALLSLCALAPPSAAAAEAPVPLPSAPSESTPLIADIDPPSPAPGDEVIIRLKRPVHDPNLSVTFDDLNADIISSNANVIRVRVPLGVPPGTKPWIALKVSGIESPPYVLTAGVASHPDPLERKLFHWLNLNFGHNFELFSYLIAIGVIGFAAAGLSFFSVGIRKQRDAIKRIKAIEVFRAELRANVDRIARNARRSRSGSGAIGRLEDSTGRAFAGRD